METHSNSPENTSTDRESDATESAGSWTRMIRTGLFTLSLVLAAVMTVLFLPDLLVLLVTGWTAEAGAELGIHRLHVMGIAAVVGVFLLGLFSQAFRPLERIASMWGAFVSILVVSIGTVVFGVGRPEEVLPFLLVTTVALVTHPAGRGLLRRGNSYSPVLLALVVVAAIPILAFVATQLSLTTNLADPHAVDGHYVMMAGLALAPLAYGVFAALGFTGWRLASWLAALPMAYYGLLSLSFPAQVGATSTTWSILAILWAVAFVVTAEYSRAGTSTLFRRDTRAKRASV
ncbi:hypothetical protein C482_17935 [Natrialba chahannaoensis JCM 10990]|uniref:Uncharacterized protein n=1 Tax=Natrialba chahannaoensis JCM 10990 TaxID=1227492 RepID=M0A9U9_9EURY|nr:hypothetical protein [Natrialba chahannaoensis]ELY94677.1 hypothetical protein C482_17935 [Natrialba chahannaoensis JCM 10990]